MNHSSPTPLHLTNGTDRRFHLAALGLAVATIIAYATSFRGVMVFDDFYSIVENPTIRDLSKLQQVLSPPASEGGTISGRPVVNLTLALNYAISGFEPWSYHLVNLGIHVLSGLILFGLVWRTTVQANARKRLITEIEPRYHACLTPRNAAWPMAVSVAALWLLHPVQTSAVTYLVQRAESMMGMCFLLTLYCFVRSVHPRNSRRWQILAFLACLTGMGCKEVMVAAPLVVLLYDRIFVANSWREIWRRRCVFHGSLLGTWTLLAGLVLSTHGRGGTAGFGASVAWWEYALTQCSALVVYLRLAAWPHPLVFDYGTPVVATLAPVAPQVALLLLLVGGTIWALGRKPALGFLGACFFLILAPSSSIVPVATQTMAEHRMYLPLAAVLLVLVHGIHRFAGRYILWIALPLALVAGVATMHRNLVYHHEITLWEDTVAHRPENARARTNFGIALMEAGRLTEAVVQFQESLRLQVESAATQLNLCAALTRLDRAAEAVPHGEAALQLDPDSAGAHLNLAVALTRVGRAAEAITHYEEARRLQPDSRDVADALAAAWLDAGNRAASRENFVSAIVCYRKALDLAPTQVRARNNLANALFVTGQLDEAILHYEAILRQTPADQLVQENLALALEMQRRRR